MAAQVEPDHPVRLDEQRSQPAEVGETAARAVDEHDRQPVAAVVAHRDVNACPGDNAVRASSAGVGQVCVGHVWQHPLDKPHKPPMLSGAGSAPRTGTVYVACVYRTDPIGTMTASTA